MAKYQKKIEAHKMRRAGVSILTIAQKLSVSKSTVSLWCRDIILTPFQQKRLHENMILAGHRGRMMGAAMNKEKRLGAIKEAFQYSVQNVGKLSKRDLLFLGLGLYWGEGNKNAENQFIFVNSDLFVIKTIIKWLQNVMGIPQELLSPQVYINDLHQYRVDKVVSFWSKELSIPKDRFGKTILIHVQNKKVYANHNNYMGTLHLYVQRSSILKYRTMAMLETTKVQI